MKQLVRCVLVLRSLQDVNWFLGHMYLVNMFVKLPLHGFHCCSRISCQPGPPEPKSVSQLEHLPCSPDLSFCVILRCGLFMLRVPPVTSLVDREFSLAVGKAIMLCKSDHSLLQ